MSVTMDQLIDDPDPKPCPFCGGMDLIAHHLWVACRSCGASGPGPRNVYRGEESPKVAWNRRASPQRDTDG